MPSNDGTSGATARNVGIGVGVALGVLFFLFIILLIVGLLTSKRRVRDMEQEIERRQRAVVERHIAAQTQWRQQRLQDVVLVLVDRGEASEGVPLAFQLPNGNEVSARRVVRSSRRISSVERALAEQQELSLLGPEGVQILNKPLEELLANGRPQEAEPAPDIMQMLLEGHADRVVNESSIHEEEEDGEDSEFFTEVSELDAEHAREADVFTHASTGEGHAPGDSPMANAHSRKELQQAAIIRKLHGDDRQGGRRRKTAEEAFGVGCNYTPNPANEALYQQYATDAKELQAEQNVKTPFFTSPFSPKKNKRTKTFNRAENTNKAGVGNNANRMPSNATFESHEPASDAHR